MTSTRESRGSGARLLARLPEKLRVFAYSPRRHSQRGPTALVLSGEYPKEDAENKATGTLGVLGRVPRVMPCFLEALVHKVCMKMQ